MDSQSSATPRTSFSGHGTISARTSVRTSPTAGAISARNSIRTNATTATAVNASTDGNSGNGSESGPRRRQFTGIKFSVKSYRFTPPSDVDTNELAHRLHGTILKENREIGYDPYAHIYTNSDKNSNSNTFLSYYKTADLEEKSSYSNGSSSILVADAVRSTGEVGIRRNSNAMLAMTSGALDSTRARATGFNTSLVNNTSQEDVAKDSYVSNTRDTLLQTYYCSDDPTVLDAIDRIQADELRRTFIKGPSITREKFTEKYWRAWKTEKDLLQEISRQEFFKNNGNSGKRKKRYPKIIRKAERDCHTVAFAGAKKLDDPVRDSFDYHIIKTKNTIPELLKHSYSAVEVNSKTKQDSGSSEIESTFTVPKGLGEENSPYDPDAIGNAKIKGGGLSMGNRFGKQNPPITAGCDLTAMGSLLADNKGTLFPSAPRFPKQNSTINTRKSGSQVSAADVSLVDATDNNKNAGFTFSRDQRSKDNTINDAPSPTRYNVPRLFDPNPHKLNQNSRNFEEIYEKYKDDRTGLLEMAPPKLSKIAVFGEHCNRQEHVLYGMCLSGHCCNRGFTEDGIIRSNDLRRLSGYEAVSNFGKELVNTSTINESIVGLAMAEILPNPDYEVDALYAAGLNNDADLIKRLAEHKVDPNSAHRETRLTALHAAVFRRNWKAVAALIDNFKERIKLDPMDKNGDTPLHIAARSGFTDIVQYLCDETDLEPNKVLNYNGQTAGEVAKGHKDFQLIQLKQEKIDLERELQQLRKRNRQKESLHN